MSKSGLLSGAALILVAAAGFFTGAFLWFEEGQEVSEQLVSQELRLAEGRRSETRRKLYILHAIRSGNIDKAIEFLEKDVRVGLNPPWITALPMKGDPFFEALEERETPTPDMVSSGIQYQEKYCAGASCLGLEQ